MRFNGVELHEVTADNWNGKTRSMVVWNTSDATPSVGEVYGVFFTDSKPVWSVRILGKELKAEHVADIPNIETKNTAEMIKLREKINEYSSTCQFMRSQLEKAEQKNKELQSINDQYYFIDQCINKKVPCSNDFVNARLKQMYRDWDFTWNFEGDLIHVRFADMNGFPKSGWDIWLTNTLDLKLKRRRHDRDGVTENFD